MKEYLEIMDTATIELGSNDVSNPVFSASAAKYEFVRFGARRGWTTCFP